ncbi:MAG: hypothetical protein ABSE90_00755 [Verrucomicrobiota bacterium]|jgi:hypothetical protein
MTIGPVTNSHREISVTEPVSPALERVKTMLFKPFDLGKWFTIGFCAWLAFLGEGGGGGGFNNVFGNNFNANNGGSAGESFRHGYHQARDFVLNNLVWIVPVAAGAVILLLALWILILWLSSRGRFMFLHCVALDKAEVAEPWNEFMREANSLFRFRLALGLIGMVLMLPMLSAIAVLIVRMVLRGEPDMVGIMVAAGLGLAFLLLAIVLALIQKFTTDFVVPIQFLRGGKCLAAWKEFRGLLADNAGLFTLYILFQIVLGMAIGIIVLGAVLITCCIAGCLMIIPYIGTVVLLPVLVFKRTYPLYFLRQFGPGYDVFPPASTDPPTAGLQPPTRV